MEHVGDHPFGLGPDHHIDKREDKKRLRDDEMKLG